MAKFMQLNLVSTAIAKTGKKSNGDKAPILRALRTKNQFRMNALMAKDLDVAIGDRVLFVKLVAEEGTFYVLMKDILGDPATGSAKLAGIEKENTTVGSQNLTFNYSGIYTDLFAYASKKLDFDATLKAEARFKVADQFVASELPNGDEYGDVPAILLEASSYSIAEDENEVEDTNE